MQIKPATNFEKIKNKYFWHLDTGGNANLSDFLAHRTVPQQTAYGSKKYRTNKKTIFSFFKLKSYKSANRR
jgi:competence CoiA-like predicted nuclease